MPPKRKAKKGKAVIDQATQNKIDKLKTVLTEVKTQATNYERYLQGECVRRCKEIEKLYSDQLNSIPEKMRNMTIAQAMEWQEKENDRKTGCPVAENAIRIQYERQKITSERKKTARKEKKRSISAPSSSKGIPQPRLPLTSNLNRTTSEMSLLTPMNRLKKNSIAVTPKFNPQYPVAVARKPKPGETIMSLSGSPLRNYVDDLPTDKNPKVTLSLGQGKVITFNDNGEIEGESEFIKAIAIDEPIKKTILDVQKKLNEILKK